MAWVTQLASLYGNEPSPRAVRTIGNPPLGSGFGVGLGLAQGPNTYSQPSLMAALKSCMAEAMDGGTPPVRIAPAIESGLREQRRHSTAVLRRTVITASNSRVS